MSNAVNFLPNYPLSYFDEHRFPELKDTTLLRRVDLYYDLGSSDKVYIILIVKNANGDRATHVFWGRNGQNLQHAKRLFLQLYNAHQYADEKKDEKLSKQYTLRVDYVFPGKGTAQTIVAAPLSIVKFNMPATGIVKNEFKYVLDKNYALEYLPPEDNWCFLVFSSNSFTIFDRNRLHIENVPLRDYVDHLNYVPYIGASFLCYKDRKGHYAIFDFIYHSTDQGKSSITKGKGWNARRAMMTSIFAAMSPSNDPFDSDLNVYLNDYMYDEDDKSNYLISPKQECLLFRKITSKIHEKNLIKRI